MDDLLSPREAAQYLRVSLKTLQRLHLRAGAPPRVAIPSATGARPIVRYRRADLDAYLTRRTEAAHDAD
jgi:hypothetical protein